MQCALCLVPENPAEAPLTSIGFSLPVCVLLTGAVEPMVCQAERITPIAWCQLTLPGFLQPWWGF